MLTGGVGGRAAPSRGDMSKSVSERSALMSRLLCAAREAAISWPPVTPSPPLATPGRAEGRGGRCRAEQGGLGTPATEARRRGGGPDPVSLQWGTAQSQFSPPQRENLTESRSDGEGNNSAQSDAAKDTQRCNPIRSVQRHRPVPLRKSAKVSAA